jgi:ABC-type multidrug transport system ATPase subunit
VIEVDRISKSFGSTRALADVDLAVERGTVFALLGPNGAGKTTLVRILTTLLKRDGGRARVAGCDVVRDASRLRAAIGLAGQYAAVDELLTGRETSSWSGSGTTSTSTSTGAGHSRCSSGSRSSKPATGSSRPTPAA